MKKVTMYKTTDNKLFNSLKEAKEHSRLQKEIINTLKLLGGSPRDKECTFASGKGYYQISKENIVAFDRKFRQLLRQENPSLAKEFKEEISDEIVVKSGYVGRYLSDTDTPLYSLYIVRNCLDVNNRRWGQMYFANNPSEGLDKCLGKIE